ncbi:uncharacterized protein LOC119636785 [Glossina fuscipes]|uniref:Uncharacterized protein LOC119636785 n=1 Tax=Glossina fuscipes TaxID=7396 RepID=A0A9C6DR17_9MUSC|nr:uncharacterized protein LOC119636785 [Glossina fuscipes]KAI9583304.1 hypothetical protein GQX74_012521 [Glossina fuscipes]
MKVFIVFLVFMIIGSTSAFRIIHRTLSKLFECQKRENVPMQDWFAGNLPDSDLTKLVPNHKCAVYCQNEAFGLTTNGILNPEAILRFLPELEKIYNVADMVRYCQHAGASNNCEGALKLNICFENYRLPTNNSSIEKF